MELHRQGAKAAARGDCATANPMLCGVNQPGHTGERLEVWEARRDAWWRGHAGYAPGPSIWIRADGDAATGLE